MNPAELTGRARTHLRDVPEFGCALHVDAVTAFRALHRAAGQAGFDLAIVSSFRDFERQLGIWNAKYRGQRPLHGLNGEPLDVGSLTAAQRVAAILLWSALPGASRHHWGTDVDVIDARSVAPGYRVQLNSAEFAEDGPFAPLSSWLETHAARYGFFRPFRGVLSGVGPEPWHLSFAPVAEPARRALTPATLRDALGAALIEGRDVVLAQLDGLHARYVAAIDWP